MSFTLNLFASFPVQTYGLMDSFKELFTAGMATIGGKIGGVETGKMIFEGVRTATTTRKDQAVINVYTCTCHLLVTHKFCDIENKYAHNIVLVLTNQMHRVFLSCLMSDRLNF
jgi:hypothetical protein